MTHFYHAFSGKSFPGFDKGKSSNVTKYFFLKSTIIYCLKLLKICKCNCIYTVITKYSVM